MLAWAVFDALSDVVVFMVLAAGARRRSHSRHREERDCRHDRGNSEPPGKIQPGHAAALEQASCPAARAVLRVPSPGAKAPYPAFERGFPKFLRGERAPNAFFARCALGTEGLRRARVLLRSPAWTHELPVWCAT
jgi:hypothetical protein